MGVSVEKVILLVVRTDRGAVFDCPHLNVLVFPSILTPLSSRSLGCA